MPDDIPPPDALTLARYLSGEGSGSEASEVENWIAADPANRRLVEALRLAWSRPRPPEFDSGDVLWNRIAARLDQPIPRPTLVPERGRAAEPRWRDLPTRRVVRLLPAAAAVILVIAGAALLERSRRASAPVSMREVATRRGQRAALSLPDGSRVLLAPDSWLRIPTADGGTRTKVAIDLYLQGEAYFDVRHDSTRPFRVHTATALIEDIGTEFVVAAYPETPRMRVAVVSGVVALRRYTRVAALRAVDSANARPLLTLTRGNLAELDSTGTAVLTRDVNLDPYVSWTQGSLVFDGTPLRDVVPMLARWYDLDIQLTDSALGGRRLTASFRDEPVSQVLELIGRSLEVQIERQGRSIVVSRKGS